MNIEPDALKGTIPSATALICTKKQFINSSRNQMQDHLTTAEGPQWRREPLAQENGSSLTSTPKPLRVAIPPQGPHLLLVGDRHMLRALRAAEMAAWNATPPVTRNSLQNVSSQRKAVRLPVPPVNKNESLLLAILALGALASVCIGVQDMNALLMGWSHMVNGIRSLLL